MATRKTAWPDWYTPELRAEDEGLVGAHYRCEWHGVTGEGVILDGKMYCTGDECTVPMLLVSTAMRVPEGENSWNRFDPAKAQKVVVPKRRRAAPVDQADEVETVVTPERELPSNVVEEVETVPVTIAEGPVVGIEDVRINGEPATVVGVEMRQRAEEPARPILTKALIEAPAPRPRKRRADPAASVPVVAVSAKARSCDVCRTRIAAAVPYVLVVERGLNGRICVHCGIDGDAEIRSAAAIAGTITVEPRDAA